MNTEKPLVIVLVRWNLPLGGRRAARAARMRSDPAWHERRLQIWRALTMPAFQRQTWDDFEVWLLCDPAQPGQGAALAGTLGDDRRFRIVTDFVREKERIYLSYPGRTRIVMARCDSDDLCHPNLLQAFADTASVSRKPCYQAMDGYAMDLATGTLYRWENPSPPFFAVGLRAVDLALGHPQGDIHLAANHGDVAATSLNISRGRPLFCVTLGGGNIFNSTAASWLGPEIVGDELARARADFGLEAWTTRRP